jgi:hypothetical protein
VTKELGVDPTKRKQSRINIVWREHRALVEAEMRNLYEDEDHAAAWNNRTKLRLWPTAARNVYRELNNQEKADIDRKIAQVAAEGNPPDIQQRRARKLGAAKIAKWSEERWKDMGMFTMTFFAYRESGTDVAIGM